MHTSIWPIDNYFLTIANGTNCRCRRDIFRNENTTAVTSFAQDLSGFCTQISRRKKLLFDQDGGDFILKGIYKTMDNADICILLALFTKCCYYTSFLSLLIFTPPRSQKLLILLYIPSNVVYFMSRTCCVIFCIVQPIPIRHFFDSDWLINFKWHKEKVSYSTFPKLKKSEFPL